MRASRIVEALLFASEAPLAPADLARADEALDEERVEAAVAELRAEYDREARAFSVVEVGGGYQLLTRPEFAPVLERFDTVPASQRLSGPALETLAIIAYRQPVGRAEVEEIRGVGAGRGAEDAPGARAGGGGGAGRGAGPAAPVRDDVVLPPALRLPSLDDLPRPEELPVVLADRENNPRSRMPQPLIF
jgi:segregation and condensation protein B